MYGQIFNFYIFQNIGMLIFVVISVADVVILRTLLLALMTLLLGMQ